MLIVRKLSWVLPQWHTCNKACLVWPGEIAGWRELLYANSIAQRRNCSPSRAAFMLCACSKTTGLRVLREDDFVCAIDKEQACLLLCACSNTVGEMLYAHFVQKPLVTQ